MSDDYKGIHRRKGDRRGGKDRRINSQNDYNGPERRKGERRSGGDRRRNGYYR